MSWDYGDAYKRHPIQNGVAMFSDGSKLKVHDIFNPIPKFMLDADIIFCDPPWNKGNLSTFYTKAGIAPPDTEFKEFYDALFLNIKRIAPKTAYIEIGKEYLADFMEKMRGIFKYVAFYNSTYYHKKDSLCYIVRGSSSFKKPKLDGMDEEDIIEWVCANEKYSCIADLCMGRGLVAVNAYKNGKRFVGTELNHKRLSVALERLSELGATYDISEETPQRKSEKLRAMREESGFTRAEMAKLIGVTVQSYHRYETDDYAFEKMSLRTASKISSVLGLPVPEIWIE